MSLTFRQFAPPLDFAHLVQCLWTLEGVRPSSDVPDPVPSDGCVEILFNGGASVTERRDPVGAAIVQPSAAIVGPTLQPLLLDTAGPMRIAGVRLWPWAVRAVLGIPGDELRDRTLSLAEIGLRDADIDWRLESPSRVAPIATWLARSVTAQPHVAVREIAQRIMGDEPANIQALVHDSGMSWRHVNRLFASEVGLSPKELARLKRLNGAIALMRARPNWTLSRVATHAGYYDQPHFVREFKALTGCTPGALPVDDGITGAVTAR